MTKNYDKLFKIEPSSKTDVTGAKLYEVSYRKNIFGSFHKIGNAIIFPGVDYTFSSPQPIGPRETAYLDKQFKKLVQP